MELLKKYYYLVAGLFAFIIYLFTIAPSIMQIDVGELAAVQATLGIAHPTGYPLYTIIGYLFSLIPLPFTKIFQLNLLAVIYCSAGISIFVYTAKLILDNITLPSRKKSKTAKNKKQKKKKNRNESPDKIETTSFLTEKLKYIIAVCAGLILAFSETYWQQSTSVEVYSLHLLLINLIILFAVKAFLFNQQEENSPGLKLYLLFAAFLALGFANHMTTIMIIPGAAILFFITHKFSAASIKKISIMLLVFIPLLILIYLYLPIRASQGPTLNWGNPIDFERFIRHITGKQYQVWLFESTEAAKRQLTHFINTLPNQFSFNLVLSFIGLFASFKYAREVFYFLLLSFLFTVLYAINYDIHDIDSYFLLAYICLAFFSLFGLVGLYSFLNKKILPVVLVVAILILGQFLFNFSKANQSGIYIYEDYTKAILNSTTEGSIILSYQWDFFISGSYYFCNVEGFRKDVAIVDKELLRRSWYYDQLDNTYPYLMKNLRNEVKQFKTALVPFERGEQFNPQLLEQLYRTIMTGIIANNINERDVYIAPELYQNEMQREEFSLPEGYRVIPDHLLYKVVKENGYQSASDPEFKIRIPEEQNYYTKQIENFAGSVLSARVMYELQFGRSDRAKIYVKKLRDDLPGFDLPVTIKGIKTD